MSRKATALLAALGLLLSASLAHATERRWERDQVLERKTLTGNWNGWRDRAHEKGIDLNLAYTAGLWGTAAGGLKQGFGYEGFAVGTLALDFDKLLGLRGMSFGMSVYSYHGTEMSEELVGPLPSSTISGNEAALSFRFYEIFLRKEWLEGRIELEVGQLVADDQFFVAEEASELANGGFGFLGFGRSLQIAPFYPLAAPGAFTQLQTKNRFLELQAGLYSADPGRDESSNYGFDWSFDEGVFLLAELQAHPRILDGVGTWAVGLGASNRELEVHSLDRTVGGIGGLFFMIDQALVAPTASHLGVGGFFRGYVSLDEDRTIAVGYWDAGLRVLRPFGGRDGDSFSLAYAQTHVSLDYSRADQGSSGAPRLPTQHLVEANYQLEIADWLLLQPDLQVFINPVIGGENALVLGLRSHVLF